MKLRNTILLFPLILISSALCAINFAQTDLERDFLKCAKWVRFEEFKKCLEEGVNPNVQDRATGNAAIHFLLGNHDMNINSLDVFKALALLSKQPSFDINIKNAKTGDTALHKTAEQANVLFALENIERVMDFYRSFGIENPESYLSKDSSFSSLGGCMAKRLYNSAIWSKYLLKNGANITARNNCNELAIHKVQSGHENPSMTFQLLMAEGTPVDAGIVMRSMEFEPKDKTKLDYTALFSTMRSIIFTNSIALGVVAKLKQMYFESDLKIQSISDSYSTWAAPGERSKIFKEKLKKSARVLLYYSRLFDLMGKSESNDPQKNNLPQLPNEIIHRLVLESTHDYIQQ